MLMILYSSRKQKRHARGGCFMSLECVVLGCVGRHLLIATSVPCQICLLLLSNGKQDWSSSSPQMAFVPAV